MKYRSLLPLAVLPGLLLPAAAGAQDRPVRDPAPVRTAPFPDVPEDHWAFDAVESLRKKGILRGYPAEAAPAPKAAEVRRAPRRKPVRARRRGR